MPKRHVQVRVVDVQALEKQGSDIIPFINGDEENVPENVVLPQKTMDTTSQDVEQLICRYFGDDVCETAIAVARAESGLRCDAVGDRHLSPSSYGVFQIRAFANRPGVEELTDCEANIRYAKFMFDRQGWHPWSAYTSGAYKSFINLL